MHLTRWFQRNIESERPTRAVARQVAIEILMISKEYWKCYCLYQVKPELGNYDDFKGILKAQRPRAPASPSPWRDWMISKEYWKFPNAVQGLSRLGVQFNEMISKEYWKRKMIEVLRKYNIRYVLMISKEYWKHCWYVKNANGIDVVSSSWFQRNIERSGTAGLRGRSCALVRGLISIEYWGGVGVVLFGCGVGFFVY